jgi:5'(3')-deoxyribonucleotidase
MKTGQENKKPSSEISKSPKGANSKSVGNSTTRKIIGFDMDGVIVDHTRNKIRAAKKFGVKLKKEQTSSIVVAKFFTPEVYKKFKNYFYNNPSALYKPSLMPGVKKVLKIASQNDAVFYLISRQKYPKKAKKFLISYGLWPKYFNNQNTFFVKEVEDKETKAKELGITHYIDDEERILNALVSVENKFLFDHLDVFKNSSYARVRSWKELTKLI